MTITKFNKDLINKIKNIRSLTSHVTFTLWHNKP